MRESGGGTVLVIIQYRLGVFGFLPGQKVKDGGELNAGLRTIYPFSLSVFVNLICNLTIDSEQWTSNSH